MLIPDSNFSIPGPGSKRFRIQDPDPNQRLEVFLTQKNYFQALEKMICYNYPGCESRFFPLPDPGVKKTPDPGSGSATLVNGSV
jgi:hypothetical protein